MQVSSNNYSNKNQGYFEGWDYFPVELGVEILSYLSIPEIQRNRSVNSQFREWTYVKSLEREKAPSFGYDPEICPNMSPTEYLKGLRQEVVSLYRAGLLPKDKVVFESKEPFVILDTHGTLLNLKSCTVEEMYNHFFSSAKFPEVANCFATYLEFCILQGNIKLPDEDLPLDKKFNGTATRLLRTCLQKEKQPSALIRLLLHFEPTFATDVNFKKWQGSSNYNGIEKGKVDFSSLVFKYGHSRDLNQQNKKNLALILAALKGDIQKMEQEISQGAQRTWSYANALHRAASKGHQEAVTFLLAKGAQLVEEESGGKSVLFAAAEKEQKEMVKWLLEQDIHIESRNSNKNTVLHHIARDFNVKAKFVEWLILETRANINAQDAEGKTALFLAIETATQANSDLHRYLSNNVKRDSKEKIKRLLQLGANTEVRNNKGQTALHSAVLSKDKEIVGWLLEKGASVEVKDAQGKTPLQYAIDVGNTEIADLLQAE